MAYGFVKREDYPLARGTVSGQIKLTDGTITKGAWAMLVPPNDDWEANIKGYDFWSPVDATGHFKIDKVRPGTYALVVCGADQFEPFRQENVVVGSSAVNLGTIQWKPVTHGAYLWQIGYADRSSAEFKHGDDARHWENFAYYINDFPNDVNYTIGKSDYAKDWNYSQWTRYNKVPYWTIHFNLPKALTGKATLTLGVAASSGGVLQVQVNGQAGGKRDDGAHWNGAVSVGQPGQPVPFVSGDVRCVAAEGGSERDPPCAGQERAVPAGQGRSVYRGASLDHV